MNNQELKSRLLSIMDMYRGRANSVSSKDLAEALGISNSEFRELYSDLVCEQSAFLGSHPDFGFFMIVDEQDFKLSVGHIESRLIKLSQRKRALDQMKEKQRMISFDEGREKLKEARAEAEKNLCRT